MRLFADQKLRKWPKKIPCKINESLKWSHRSGHLSYKEAIEFFRSVFLHSFLFEKKNKIPQVQNVYFVPKGMHQNEHSKKGKVVFFTNFCSPHMFGNLSNVLWGGFRVWKISIFLSKKFANVEQRYQSFLTSHAFEGRINKIKSKKIQCSADF